MGFKVERGPGVARVTKCEICTGLASAKQALILCSHACALPILASFIILSVGTSMLG